MTRISGGRTDKKVIRALGSRTADKTTKTPGCRTVDKRTKLWKMERERLWKCAGNT